MSVFSAVVVVVVLYKTRSPFLNVEKFEMQQHHKLWLRKLHSIPIRHGLVYRCMCCRAVALDSVTLYMCYFSYASSVALWWAVSAGLSLSPPLGSSLTVQHGL